MTFAIALLLSAFMLAVMYYDGTSYKIPNWLNGTLLLLYGVWIFFAPEMPNLLHALYAFLAIFAVGYAMFAFNIMGGGDVKLLAVLALWCGWGETLLSFIILFSILGGVLALGLLVLRKMLPYYGAKMGWKDLPRLFSHGQPVPYGLAISVAFLILLWKDKLPGIVI